MNRQIHEDFAPYWGMSATLRLEGRSVNTPDKIDVADMRGDAVIYLWNQADVPNAIGYHFQNNRGIPFGFVFTEIARSIGEPWSVTLSHEALELIGDPETNLLVMGPHPTEDRDVFHWFEMCDAVQAETYELDGVQVSNFLLPLYFTGTRQFDEIGARNDFWAGAQGAAPWNLLELTRAGTSAFLIRSWATMTLSLSRAIRSPLCAWQKSREPRRPGVRFATVSLPCARNFLKHPATAEPIAKAAARD